jgi:hypothetical protein
MRESGVSISMHVYVYVYSRVGSFFKISGPTTSGPPTVRTMVIQRHNPIRFKLLLLLNQRIKQAKRTRVLPIISNGIHS